MAIEGCNSLNDYLVLGLTPEELPEDRKSLLAMLRVAFADGVSFGVFKPRIASRWLRCRAVRDGEWFAKFYEAAKRNPPPIDDMAKAELDEGMDTANEIAEIVIRTIDG